MGKSIIGTVTDQMMALFAANLQAMVAEPGDGGPSGGPDAPRRVSTRRGSGSGAVPWSRAGGTAGGASGTASRGSAPAGRLPAAALTGWRWPRT